MKRTVLMALLVLSSTGVAQTLVSRIIPDYNALAKPLMTAVRATRTDTSIEFTLHGARFSITQSGDLVQPLITARGQRGTVNRQLINASPFFPDAECRVVTFDADENGVSDLFIVFPYGLTGTAANVDIVAAYFFFPDSSFTFMMLRSYDGDTGLFRDFNHDGRYEYACVNQLWAGTDEYDAVNLFSIRNGQFTNITKNTPGYPVFVERTVSGPVVVKELPAPIAEHWYLKQPDVLVNRAEALN